MASISRSARIEARVAPETLELIKRAAELQGRSISDFVVSAAQELALATVEEAHIVRLSLEDQERFARLLIDPPARSPALERARLHHQRLIESDNV